MQSARAESTFNANRDRNSCPPSTAQWQPRNSATDHNGRWGGGIAVGRARTADQSFSGQGERRFQVLALGSYFGVTHQKCAEAVEPDIEWAGLVRFTL